MTLEMAQAPELGDLRGIRLSVVRRAADMLVLHFGSIKPHWSGRGTVGDMALHVQCPWRLQDSSRVLTGKEDLHDFAGGGAEPEGWDYEQGSSRQDLALDRIFGDRDPVLGWSVSSDKFLVKSVDASPFGDIDITFSGGCRLQVFPVATVLESWRLFIPDSDGPHLVFPAE